MSDTKNPPTPAGVSPQAIVLAHGDVADALVAAVDLITGRGDRFSPLSNQNLGAAEIDALLRERVDALGAHVIFTDLPAGSCNFAACRLLKDRPDLIVVTGVNLPALLQYATRDTVSDAEAIADAVERGGSALRVLRGRPSAH
ncbi:MAG: PTS sugar transporter subunit IIA [Gemmatimonadaceae bacterium]|jgi:mannose/fructose-specific phosphotransferase system component IIA